MKKTLLLYSRICPDESNFTIKIFEELKKNENITAVKIDGNKPFDISHEQEFIKQFDEIIVLFTINWFNLPWSLSRYMAEVWRTGVFNLENKKFYTIVTTGSSNVIYSDDGFGWTVAQYLNNFYSVLKRLKATHVKQFTFNNCVNEKSDGENFTNFITEIKEYFSK